MGFQKKFNQQDVFYGRPVTCVKCSVIQQRLLLDFLKIQLYTSGTISRPSTSPPPVSSTALAQFSLTANGSKFRFGTFLVTTFTGKRNVKITLFFAINTINEYKLCHVCTRYSCCSTFR